MSLDRGTNVGEIARNRYNGNALLERVSSNGRISPLGEDGGSIPPTRYSSSVTMPDHRTMGCVDEMDAHSSCFSFS